MHESIKEIESFLNSCRQNIEKQRDELSARYLAAIEQVNPQDNLEEEREFMLQLLTEFDRFIDSICYETVSQLCDVLKFKIDVLAMKLSGNWENRVELINSVLGLMLQLEEEIIDWESTTFSYESV